MFKMKLSTKILIVLRATINCRFTIRCNNINRYGICTVAEDVFDDIAREEFYSHESEYREGKGPYTEDADILEDIWSGLYYSFAKEFKNRYMDVFNYEPPYGLHWFEYGFTLPEHHYPKRIQFLREWYRHQLLQEKINERN